jgi:transposase-like protein
MQYCIMLHTMLSTYLAQLDQEAHEAGVDLSEACERAGIASTTLQRWRRGDVSPREATAKAVIAEIHALRMARAQPASEKAA